MQFSDDHPVWGHEFDWVAKDCNESLGYFSTAGAGLVPTTCLSSDAAIETLFEDVMRLPAISAVEIVDQSSRDISDWISVAERGFHGYDWSREMSHYVLVAKPKEPIKSDSLPTALRTTAEATILNEDLTELEYLIT